MNVVFDVMSHSRGLGVRGLRRKEDFTTKARSARRSMIVYTFLRVLRVFVVKNLSDLPHEKCRRSRISNVFSRAGRLMSATTLPANVMH
jgi:hypothetical protein